jgi:hypothetical protein
LNEDSSSSVKKIMLIDRKQMALFSLDHNSAKKDNLPILTLRPTEYEELCENKSRHNHPKIYVIFGGMFYVTLSYLWKRRLFQSAPPAHIRFLKVTNSHFVFTARA